MSTGSIYEVYYGVHLDDDYQIKSMEFVAERDHDEKFIMNVNGSDVVYIKENLCTPSEAVQIAQEMLKEHRNQGK